ncbi:MAG: hydrogenase maturation protease [Anaerolineae bacterium]|jgi:hydrogenase maturation protease
MASSVMAQSLLIVGYGNDSRRDDGVAAHILVRLLERLGLGEDEIGGDDELDPEPGLKVLFLHQLAPELAELAAEYETVVFVDAHVPEAGWDPLSWQSVESAVEGGMVGHHLRPGTVIALADQLYGQKPQAYLLSVQGHDFDFGWTLSPETEALAERAVDKLLQLVAERGLMPAGR